MQLEILRSLNPNDPLAIEWNELLTCCSASHVPFLRYEYLSSWWKTLGGGEWKNGELFTVLGRQDDHTLSGVAPLFFTQNPAGEPVLMLLGSIEISDYLDFIVRRARHSLIYRSVVRFTRLRPSPGLAGIRFLQPAGDIAYPGCPPGGGRAEGLALPARTTTTLPLYPAARRLGSLPGRHRQETAPRNPPQDAPC